jgi:hypothetical protein
MLPTESKLCIVVQVRMRPEEVDRLYRIALHRDQSLSALVREQLEPLLVQPDA